MGQDSENNEKNVFFDRVQKKVSILQGVSFELIHDLLKASGSDVAYAITPDETVISDCKIDGIDYVVMLLDANGDGVRSVDKIGETLLFRLALAAPEDKPHDELIRVANGWNLEHISGRSFAHDGILIYEFRLSINGITSEYFEDHIFEWYDTIGDFINFVVEQSKGEG